MVLAKQLSLLPILLLALSCGRSTKPEHEFHIGVCTGTVSQSEDEVRGAEQLIKEYGSVARGGRVRHLTFPDDFMSQQETVISNLVATADDPHMKVLVACQAYPGVTEAFRRIRERRPDILLLAGVPHEDPLVIQKAADLVLDLDNIARGYAIPWTAKQMGAKALVHISFPRHMSYEMLSRRRAIMQAACADLGLAFGFESAPDPTSDVGVAGAQQFMLEKVPQWLRKYGPKGERVCLFSTNDSHMEPLIKQVVTSRNGLFVEADIPSPLMGYPGALGLDLQAERGNFAAIMKKIEWKLATEKASGRLATWPCSAGYAFTAGLGELGKRVVEGRAQLHNFKDLQACLGKYTPGAQWQGTPYRDLSTGTVARNQAMLYMDTYIFGKGGLATTQLQVPQKYRRIAR